MWTLSDNQKGAAMMVGSMTAFTVNDALIKGAGEALPLFQVIFLRGLAVCVFLFVLTRVMGQWRGMSRSDWGWTWVRTLAEIAAAYLFLTALFNMNIADASAILQALPLTVTLAAVLFFGEKIGIARISAILVGFVGMLLIVQPGGQGFSVYSLYAVGAVVAVTARDMAARKLTKEAPSLMVAFVAAVGVMGLGALGSAGGAWAPMTPWLWGLIGASAFVVMLAYILSITVMRVGDVGFIAPFRYTSLLVALVLGLVFFDEWPDALTLCGAVIVVAAGLFTLFREHRLQQRHRRGPDPAAP